MCASQDEKWSKIEHDVAPIFRLKSIVNLNEETVTVASRGTQLPQSGRFSQSTVMLVFASDFSKPGEPTILTWDGDGVKPYLSGRNHVRITEPAHSLF